MGSSGSPADCIVAAGHLIRISTRSFKTPSRKSRTHVRLPALDVCIDDAPRKNLRPEMPTLRVPVMTISETGPASATSGGSAPATRSPASHKHDTKDGGLRRVPQANTWLDVTDLLPNSMARTNLVVGLSLGVLTNATFNGDEVNFLANGRVRRRRGA